MINFISIKKSINFFKKNIKKMKKPTYSPQEIKRRFTPLPPPPPPYFDIDVYLRNASYRAQWVRKFHQWLKTKPPCTFLQQDGSLSVFKIKKKIQEFMLDTKLGHGDQTTLRCLTYDVKDSILFPAPAPKRTRSNSDQESTSKKHKK